MTVAVFRTCRPTLFTLLGCGALAAFAQDEQAIRSPIYENTASEKEAITSPVNENNASSDSAAKPCQYRKGQAPEMVLLQGGEFLMGSDAEKSEQPPHTVLIQPFAISRCEVTVAEFAEFVNETAYPIDGCSFWNGEKYEEDPEKSWQKPSFEQRESSPVTCVTWHDAQAYALWISLKTGVGYRLPSEAEWEYAARGGTSTAFSTGDCIGSEEVNFGGIVNEVYKDCAAAVKSPGSTTPVAAYPANPFGLYDMHGNVWEWVEDCWHRNYQEAPETQSPWLEENNGDCTRRVLRGGSWVDDAGDLRSASRDWLTTNGRSGTTGIRLARTLSNEEMNAVPSSAGN